MTRRDLPAPKPGWCVVSEHGFPIFVSRDEREARAEAASGHRLVRYAPEVPVHVPARNLEQGGRK